MIISASRRTDIPAFYSRWLINRIRAGYCLVPNPFLPSQVATVSLAEEDVDAIVFWSRNPRPVFDYLNELDCRGYRYYFQFTLMNYPEMIDAHTPGVDRAVATFRSLAERIGPECVIWRYDPILLSETIPPDYHRASFEHIAKGLCGYTRRVVISFMDIYTKTRSRMEQLEARGTRLYPGFDVIRGDGGDLPEEAGILVRDLVEIARNCGMEIVSCAEPLNLQPFGVLSGSCIDTVLIKKLFKVEISNKKDPNQRKTCGCAVSKDIGMYDSCLFGCQYCYATHSFERAWKNYHSHDPDSPSLY